MFINIQKMTDQEFYVEAHTGAQVESGPKDARIWARININSINGPWHMESNESELDHPHSIYEGLQKWFEALKLSAINEAMLHGAINLQIGIRRGQPLMV